MLNSRKRLKNTCLCAISRLACNSDASFLIHRSARAVAFNCASSSRSLSCTLFFSSCSCAASPRLSASFTITQILCIHFNLDNKTHLALNAVKCFVKLFNLVLSLDDSPEEPGQILSFGESHGSWESATRATLSADRGRRRFLFR